ncbi:AtpZ/AtpI family protein [Cereibacter sp. SYSU M97828]|nr:AtpZ/AtpI family protein [Cereibacter flavus]
MSEDPDHQRMRDLEARIAKVKGEPKRQTETGKAFSGGEIGWRMVTELLSGMLIGLAIGYGLDWIFGTMPVFLVIFCLFGFAAGVKTMLGTAKMVQEKHEKGGDTPKKGN